MLALQTKDEFCGPTFLFAGVVGPAEAHGHAHVRKDVLHHAHEHVRVAAVETGHEVVAERRDDRLHLVLGQALWKLVGSW